MPLWFTGERDTHGDTMAELLEAEDQDGNRVVVRVSREAFEDYDLDVIKEKASQKFDDKDFDQQGRVFVVTDDFL